MSKATAPGAAALADILAGIESVNRLQADVRAKRTELESIRIRQDEVRPLRERLAAEIARTVLPPRPEATMKPLREDLAALDAELSGLHARAQAIEKAVSDMEAHIKEVSLTPDHGLVALHQRAVEDLQARAETLRSHRDELAAETGAQTEPGPLAELLRELEDILAAIAIGEPRKADLGDLQARIDTAQAQADSDAAQAETRRQALAGINRRLEETEGELKRLHGLGRTLLGHLLAADLQEVAARYEDSARKAADYLVQVQALDALRQQHAPEVPSGLNFGHVRSALFPGLLSGQVLLTYAAHPASIQARMNAALEQEAYRLAAQGVRLV